MRVDWLSSDEIDLALRLLTPTNRLVMELCITTGLRISDALQIQTSKLKPRMTVHEAKTGKSRRVVIPAAIYEAMSAQAGRTWVFEGARDPERHRTRQAVWKDVKRAAKAARIPANAGTHTARKIYAVALYRRRGMAAVQTALNHDDRAVTMVYALADQLRQRRAGPTPRRRKKLT